MKVISLADTVGLADPGQVARITRYLVEELPGVETGLHLHSTPHNREAKIKAGLEAGCLRFDGALKGIGGCPMADDILVGNVDTEWMIHYFGRLKLLPPLDDEALKQSLWLAEGVFTQHQNL